VMGLGGSSIPSGSSFGSRPKSSGARASGSTTTAAEPKPAVESSSGGGLFNPNNGLIICSSGDFVCGVVPNIGGSVPKATASDTAPAKAGAGHLSYSADGSIPKAIAFITTRVNGGASSGPAS
jgi:hypothetical protein